MQFKVDENLPDEVAEILRQWGHDALTVNDQDLSGEIDERLAIICREENRTIITLDTGFSDIRAYPPEAYPGLIVLRLARQEKPHILAVLNRLVPFLNRETVLGRLWVVDEGGFRIRGGE